MNDIFRCVMDVNEKCSSGRKRREINSDILTALIKSSGPIINFLNIGQEIFGTRYMYVDLLIHRHDKKVLIGCFF
jgi:hypothetical protein